MAERAHPDDQAFQDKWHFWRRRGVIPWARKLKNPYREAFFWRYQWVSRVCRDKDVIDIPCGMGWGTSLIRGARSLKGFDISIEAIKEANQRYASHADFSVGNMANLNLQDSSLDIVSCLEGIEHVPKDIARTFLAEAQRVLRKGGLLMISSPFCRTQPHSGNPYHIHEYQPEEIQQILTDYFIIKDVISRDVDNLTILYITCVKQ
jgi:ubiquinone/menaquinone biosynthesis C-methylase UbiE